MARGFESKSVADQQEAKFGLRRDPATPPRDPALAQRRRKLELARADIVRRLELAQAPAHREGLEKALAALEAELSGLA